MWLQKGRSVRSSRISKTKVHCRGEGSPRQMPGLLSIHSRASFAVTKATRFLFFFFFYPNPASPELSFLFFFFLVLKKRLARVSFINKISRSTLFKSMKLKEEFLRRRRRSFKIIGDNLSNQDPYLTKISRVYSWRKIET